MSNDYGNSPGPFVASQLKDGDRYELSNGHPVYSSPAGGRHAGHNLDGGAVLGTDPEVAWAGVDAGYSPKPGDLRAPDIAVGGEHADQDGWIPGAPPLAVEYAGKGQDESDLRRKIAALLAAGTHYVWVVRLLGPACVEVYERGQPTRTLGLADTLEAPGILRNPVPVRAFFDRDASFQHMLGNLLQRRGYQDLEAVLAEGRQEGRAEGRQEGREEGRITGEKSGLRFGLFTVLACRDLPISPELRARIEACNDSVQLQDWLEHAARAVALEDIFEN